MCLSHALGLFFKNNKLMASAYNTGHMPYWSELTLQFKSTELSQGISPYDEHYLEEDPTVDVLFSERRRSLPF